MADPRDPRLLPLQLVTSTDRRGAEIAAVQLGESLGALGRPVDTKALWPGTAGTQLDLPSYGSRRRDPRALAALVRDARARPVLVGQGSSTLPFGAAAATAAGVPFVYRSIGDPRFWGTTRARRARVRLALSRARRVVALWPGAADALRALYDLPPSRVDVIPVGVAAAGFSPTSPGGRPAARRDLAAFLGVDIDADRPLVAYLGALSDEKHPLLAVEAMRDLPDAQLVVAGAGPLAGEVAARAERAGGGRIVPVGSLAEPARLLAAADALVLTSRSEGIPAVTIEAGLAGLPVVSTDVGGVAEVVVDGETGRIVPSFLPRAVAAALREVLGDAGEAMGQAARVRCLAHFSLDVVARQWLPVLDAASGTVTR